MKNQRSGIVTDICLRFSIDFIQEWLKSSHQKWTASVGDCINTDPSCFDEQDCQTVVGVSAQKDSTCDEDKPSACAPTIENDVLDSHNTLSSHDSQSPNQDQSLRQLEYREQDITTASHQEQQDDTQNTEHSPPAENLDQVTVTQEDSSLILRITCGAGLQVKQGRLEIAVADVRNRTSVASSQTGETVSLLPKEGSKESKEGQNKGMQRKRGRPRKKVAVDSAMHGDNIQQDSTDAAAKDGLPRADGESSSSTGQVNPGAGKSRYSLRGRKLPASIFGYSDSEEEGASYDGFHQPSLQSSDVRGVATDDGGGGISKCVAKVATGEVSFIVSPDEHVSMVSVSPHAAAGRSLHVHRNPEEMRKHERGKENKDAAYTGDWSPAESHQKRKTRAKRKNLEIGELPKFTRRKRNNKKLASCKYCQRKFCDYTGVSMHVRKFHMDSPDVSEYLTSLKKLEQVQCSICGVECDDRLRLQQHEDKEHYKFGSFPCSECGKVWPNVISLKNHVRTVHLTQGKSHACSQCDARFKWASTLKQHIHEIHAGSVKNWTCDICGKKFFRQSQLKRHSIVHKPELMQLKCSLCDKRFGFLNNLKRHMSIVHTVQQSEEQFHCSYCGKGFFRKAALISHVEKVHFSLFPHRCHVCKARFSRAALLVKHMAVEHNNKNFKAPPARRSHFKYYRSDEEALCCKFCTQTFYYKAKLVEHIHATHGDTFPFQCTECGQGFLDRKFLHVHLRQAHGKEETAVGDLPGLHTGGEEIEVAAGTEVFAERRVELLANGQVEVLGTKQIKVLDNRQVQILADEEVGNTVVSCFIPEEGSAVASTINAISTPSAVMDTAGATVTDRLTGSAAEQQPVMVVQAEAGDSSVYQVLNAGEDSVLLLGENVTGEQDAASTTTPASYIIKVEDGENTVQYIVHSSSQWSDADGLMLDGNAEPVLQQPSSLSSSSSSVVQDIASLLLAAKQTGTAATTVSENDSDSHQQVASAAVGVEEVEVPLT